MGQPLVDNFITPDQRVRVRVVLEDACQGKETANFEFPLVTKDGTRFDVLLNATTRRDKAGNPIGVVGVGQDISELNKVAAQAKFVADDLTRLIDTANAPIFGVNVKGEVTVWNRKAADLSGFSLDETFGKMLVDNFIIPEQRERVREVLENACNGKETDNFEFPLVT